MRQSHGDHRAEGEQCERTMKPAGSRILRAAVMLTLAAAMNTALAGGGTFARRSADPTAQAANSAQQQAVGAAEAAQAAMRSMESFRRLSDTRQKLLDLQAAARSAAQSAPSTVPNGLQSGGLQAADTAIANASDTLDVNSLWSGAKVPTQTQANGRTQVEIQQTDTKAILTWKSFNVGRETDVHFNQTAGGDSAKEWIALNRVTDPTLKPSTILGSITAEGQVYLINPNGILFGATSQVNVNSLIASSLDVASQTIRKVPTTQLDPYTGLPLIDPLTGETLLVDQLVDSIDPHTGAFVDRNFAFQQGILATAADKVIRPRFGETFYGSNRSRDGETFASSDGVTIQAGARISVDALGMAWFFGHNVTNAGEISATDGQVIFAAGRSVYLAGSTEDVRGALASVDRGGDALNSGIVLSRRGDITLIGKSIENLGVLEATTGTSANGSIALWAGDFTDTGDDAMFDPDPVASGTLNWRVADLPASNHQGPLRPILNGNVTLGADSVTAVTPDQIGSYRTYAEFARDYSLAGVGENLIIAYTAALRAYLEKNTSDFKVGGAADTTEQTATAIRSYFSRQPADRQSWLFYDFTLGDKGVGAAQFRPSRIDINGLNVSLKSGATVLAPGGNVLLRAMPGSIRQNLMTFDDDGFGDPINVVSQRPTSRVAIDSNALIDVAGLADVELPIESNLLAPDWRLNELRDSPLLRAGFLHGAKVPIDIRYGTTLADLSGYYALRDKDVREFMTSGGQVTLDATQIVMRAAATIDLSGGFLHYRDGYVPDTRIQGADGRVYNAATASGNAVYTGFAGEFTASHPRWGVTDQFQSPLISGGMVFQNGYVEGKDAGTLKIGELLAVDQGLVDGWANALAGAHYNQVCVSCPDTDLSFTTKVLRLDGDVIGSTVRGPNQTQHVAGSQLTPQTDWRQTPSAATLTVGPTTAGDVSGTGSIFPAATRIAVRIGETTPLSNGTSSDAPLKNDLVLAIPERWFENGDFGQLEVHTHNAPLTIDATADLNLGEYGRFYFEGWRIDVNGRIRAANGDIQINGIVERYPVFGFGTSSFYIFGADSLPANMHSGVFIHSGAELDVSGEWKNAFAGDVDAVPTGLNGGSIAIRATGAFGADVADLVLESKSLLDVSGGGYLSATERLQAGNAGQLTIAEAVKPRNVSALGLNPDLGPSRSPAPTTTLLAGDLRGFALGRGGTFTIDAARPITIEAENSNPKGAKAWDGHFGADFFTTNGFANFVLEGYRRVAVTPGTVLAPVALTYQIDPLTAPASGANLYETLAKVALPEAQQLPTNLTLRALLPVDLTPGILDIGANAQVLLAPLSSFQGQGSQITIGGTIRSLGGAIALTATQGSRAQQPVTIDLGSSAKLLASGTITEAIAKNTVTRTLRSGGNITLSSSAQYSDSMPYVDFGTIHAAAGSVIDVSGTSGFVDVRESPGSDLIGASSGASTTEFLAGDGGSTYLSARIGGDLSGALNARAGGTGARGGTLAISGPLNIKTSQLNASGADVLALLQDSGGGPNTTIDTGSVTAPRALLIGGVLKNASVSDSVIRISAPYVAINGLQVNSSGSGSELDVKTDLLDLGNASLAVAKTSFDVTGDIRFISGSLSAAGELILQSAQAYPISGMDSGNIGAGAYKLIAQSVTFKSNGAEATVPMSIGGSLAVNAQTIAQNGVLRAPAGSIAFNADGADGAVTFGKSSLTSVSAENATLPVSPTQSFNPAQGTQAILNVLPKNLILNAANIDVQSGAKINVAGGGDFYAYQFVPGNGGSKDFLNQPNTYALLPSASLVAAPLFGGASGIGAIPGFASITSGLRDDTLHVGDSLEIGASSVLPAGTYTILPAHLALLPGAVAVQFVGGGYAHMPGQAIPQADGSVLVGGRRVVAGLPSLTQGQSVGDQTYSQIRVIPQEQVRSYSQYKDYSVAALAELDALSSSAELQSLRDLKAQLAADETNNALSKRSAELDQKLQRLSELERQLADLKQLTSQPEVAQLFSAARDGGSLTMSATKTLSLGGTGMFAGVAGAQSGSAAIYAPQLAIVGAEETAPDGYLKVNVDNLNRFNIGNLLVGGTRGASISVRGISAFDPNGVTVRSNNVLIDTGGATLTIPELLAVATDKVEVTENSRIESKATVTASDTAVNISGNGAALLLGNRTGVQINRTGSSADGRGELVLGENIQLNAAGGVVLDGTHAIRIASTTKIDLGNTGELTLSSTLLNIGDVPSTATGTTLSTETLSTLANAAALKLRASQGVSFYGHASLGAVNGSGEAIVTDLVLDTPQLVAQSADTVAGIAAKDLTLTNTGGSGIAASISGAGTLTLTADLFKIGRTINAVGFNQLSINAGTMVGVESGTLATSGALNIKSDLMTVAAGQDFGVTSPTAVVVAPLGGTARATAIDGLGGRLRLTGSTIDLNTHVALPAGALDLTATSGAVHLGAQAAVELRGASRQFFDVTQTAAAGSVRVKAAGDVVFDDKSLIDVSAHTGSDGGLLEIDAGGNLRLDGTLYGTAGANGEGGRFAAQAHTLSDFSKVNSQLETGGFTGERSVRVDQGNIALGSGEKLTAHTVELRTDQGTVTVAGSIDASGNALAPNGGRVTLRGDAVDIQNTATVDADAFSGATDFPTQSGQIDVLATADTLSFATGAALSARGGNEGGGTITFTAPRTSGDIAISQFAGATSVDDGHVIVRGLKGYTTTLIDQSQIDAMRADAVAWMLNASTVAGRLGHNVVIAPAMRIHSVDDNDLTLSHDLDLHGWAGEGWLELAAARDLKIASSISDGFSDSSQTGQLLGGRSSSIDLEANRNLIVGNATVVQWGPVTITKDLNGIIKATRPMATTLPADSVRVRTGTGNISLRAGGDLLLGGGETASDIPFAQLFSTITLTDKGTVPVGVIDILSLPDGDYRNGDWAIYTGGRLIADATGFVRGTRVGYYPVEGGDLNVSVGGDIKSSPASSFITQWQYRYGRALTTSTVDAALVQQQTSWSIVYPNVYTLLGALGGGSVSIDSTGNIHDVTVAVPTTGQQTAQVGANVTSGAVVQRGGGDLRVFAGGSLFGGVYNAERGVAKIQTDGAVADDLNRFSASYLAIVSPPFPGAFNSPFRSLFAIGDAQLNVRARGDMSVAGVTDPGAIQQVLPNADFAKAGATTFFSTYTSRTSVELLSIGGDVQYDHPSSGSGYTRDIYEGIFQTAPTALSNSKFPLADTLLHPLTGTNLELAPGTMRLVAMEGSISGNLTTAPSPTGTITVLADQSVSGFSATSSNRSFDFWRTSNAPFSVSLGETYIDATDIPDAVASNNYLRGSIAVEQNNRTPSRIYALLGDIEPAKNTSGVYFNFAGPAYLRAGDDIEGLTLIVEHHTPDDQSLVFAGGDIALPPGIPFQKDKNNQIGAQSRVTIYGPGRLDVAAGGNVFLTALNSVGNGIGYSDQSTTGGALINSALPTTGADVSILAGVDPAFDANLFRDAYLGADGSASIYASKLRDYLDRIEPSIDIAALSDTEVMDRFKALPPEKQTPLLYSILFEELKGAGIDYNADLAAGKPPTYARGKKALALIFPEGVGTSGSIRFVNSKIETLSGGDFDLLAPHGGIYLDNPGGSLESKDTKVVQKYDPIARVAVDVTVPQVPVTNGIVTRRGGSIRALTADNIDLINSRTFTLQGGDITMWTSHGDITAGDGSKAVAVYPPPIYTLGSDANLELDVFGLQTGSGIGVLDSLATGGKKGRIDLIAPEGTVDAGEAGIRVQGDINIAALRVVGADNIQATGVAVGIPKAVAVNTGALTAASAAAANVGEAAADLASRAQPAVRDLPSIITVEVLGFGE